MFCCFNRRRKFAGEFIFFISLRQECFEKVGLIKWHKSPNNQSLRRRRTFDQVGNAFMWNFIPWTLKQLSRKYVKKFSNFFFFSRYLIVWRVVFLYLRNRFYCIALTASIRLSLWMKSSFNSLISILFNFLSVPFINLHPTLFTPKNKIRQGNLKNCEAASSLLSHWLSQDIIPINSLNKFRHHKLCRKGKKKGRKSFLCFANFDFCHLSLPPNWDWKSFEKTSF